MPWCKLMSRVSRPCAPSPAGCFQSYEVVKYVSLWGRYMATAARVVHSDDSDEADRNTPSADDVLTRPDIRSNVKYSFKSAAHRDMVVQLTRQDLASRLLARFGDFRQQECEILCRNRSFRKVLSLWAEILVRENPSEPAVDAFFVPPDLYTIHQFQVGYTLDTRGVHTLTAL